MLNGSMDGRAAGSASRFQEIARRLVYLRRALHSLRQAPCRVGSTYTMSHKRDIYRTQAGHAAEMITRISMNTEKEREIIFFANGEPITDGMFSKALQEIGLREGDTIFVHSDLFSFGRLVMKDDRKALNLLTNALKETVGTEGTIIMPTFTYSFINERWSGPFEDFDVDKSRSKTGALTEYFRKQEDVIRTDHPTHSVAIWGKMKDFFSDLGNSTFDKESVFEKLLEKDAKIVCVGWRNGGPMGTFHHFIEKQFGVPYRFNTTLSGKVVRDGKVYQKEIQFYQKERNISLNLMRFREQLLSTGKVEQVSLGSGVISAVRAQLLFDEGVKMLKKDPYYFVRKDTFIADLITRLKRAVKGIYVIVVGDSPWP